MAPGSSFTIGAFSLSALHGGLLSAFSSTVSGTSTGPVCCEGLVCVVAVVEVSWVDDVEAVILRGCLRL